MHLDVVQIHLNSWLTVTRLPPNILSASATSRITHCDWLNFIFTLFLDEQKIV